MGVFFFFMLNLFLSGKGRVIVFIRLSWRWGRRYCGIMNERGERVVFFFCDFRRNIIYGFFRYSIYKMLDLVRFMDYLM